MSITRQPRMILLAVLMAVPVVAGERYDATVTHHDARSSSYDIPASAGVLFGKPYYRGKGTGYVTWHYLTVVLSDGRRVGLWCADCKVPQEIPGAVQIELNGDKATLSWMLFGKKQKAKYRVGGVQ